MTDIHTVAGSQDFIFRRSSKGSCKGYKKFSSICPPLTSISYRMHKPVADKHLKLWLMSFMAPQSIPASTHVLPYPSPFIPIPAPLKMHEVMSFCSPISNFIFLFPFESVLSTLYRVPMSSIPVVMGSEKFLQPINIILYDNLHAIRYAHLDGIIHSSRMLLLKN